MANTINVDIVSAEGEIYSGHATMVFVPAIEGEIGITPRHAPLLTALKPGQVRVHPPEGGELLFYVGGGELEVQPTRVTVLADTAVRAHDLDEARVIAARQRAEEAMRQVTDKQGIAAAQAELARIAAQLDTIKRLRKIRS